MAKKKGARKSLSAKRKLTSKPSKLKAFHEIPLETDFSTPKCICIDPSHRRKGYEPHTCSIERRASDRIYEELYRTTVPKLKITENEITNRFAATTSKPLSEALDTPITAISFDECIRKLERYDELLRRESSPYKPSLAPVYSRRAALFICLRDFESAKQSALQCFELNPYHSAGAFQAGYAYCALNDPCSAAEILLKGLRYQPGEKKLELALNHAMRIESEGKYDPRRSHVLKKCSPGSQSA